MTCPKSDRDDDDMLYIQQHMMRETRMTMASSSFEFPMDALQIQKIIFSRNVLSYFMSMMVRMTIKTTKLEDDNRDDDIPPEVPATPDPASNVLSAAFPNKPPNNDPNPGVTSRSPPSPPNAHFV